MTSFGDELNQRDSATVQAALTRKCKLCKAEPGQDCRNVINYALPLPGGRIVHYVRTGR